MNNKQNPCVQQIWINKNLKIQILHEKKCEKLIKITFCVFLFYFAVWFSLFNPGKVNKKLINFDSNICFEREKQKGKNK